MEDKVIELNNKGVKLFMDGKFSEAETIYEQALEVNADHATTLNNMGMLKLKQKDFLSAIFWFDKALAENKKPVYFLNKGHACISLNRTLEAVENYKKCLDLDPRNVTAWISLARLYAAVGNFQLAVHSWEKVVQFNERVEYLIELAKSLIKIEELSQAQTVLLRASKYNEKSHEVSYFLALVAFHQKNFGFAEREAKLGLAEEPDNTIYRQLLAVIYLTIGNFSKAVGEWKKILKLEPANNIARTDLAVAYLGKRYFKEAGEQLDFVLELEPEHPKALYYKAVLLNETNNTGAMELLAKLAEKDSPFSLNAKELIQKIKKYGSSK